MNQKETEDKGAGAPYRNQGEVMEDPKEWQFRNWANDADQLPWVLFTILVMVIQFGFVAVSSVHFINWQWDFGLLRGGALSLLLLAAWFITSFERK